MKDATTAFDIVIDTKSSSTSNPHFVVLIFLRSQCLSVPVLQQ